MLAQWQNTSEFFCWIFCSNQGLYQQFQTNSKTKGTGIFITFRSISWHLRWSVSKWITILSVFAAKDSNVFFLFVWGTDMSRSALMRVQKQNLKKVYSIRCLCSCFRNISDKIQLQVRFWPGADSFGSVLCWCRKVNGVVFNQWSWS